MASDPIDAVIRREGPETNDPDDSGGRTAFGISEKSNPGAWADNRVTDEEARAIYEAKYVVGPGFLNIEHPRLREQLIDWGVNSGPSIAIQGLQRVVGADVDGVLGPQTLAALARHDERRVNNLVMVERIKMIGRILKKDPSQGKFVNGWLNRACEFVL